MTLLLPITIAVLFGCGAYLMLRRNILKLVLGLSLISHATNIILISGGWLGPGTAPFITEEQAHPPEPGHAAAAAPQEAGPHPATPPPVDPLPQALILTAIVISFASTALLLVLAYRAYIAFGSVNLADFRRQRG